MNKQLTSQKARFNVFRIVHSTGPQKYGEISPRDLNVSFADAAAEPDMQLVSDTFIGYAMLTGVDPCQSRRVNLLGRAFELCADDSIPYPPCLRHIPRAIFRQEGASGSDRIGREEHDRVTSLGRLREHVLRSDRAESSQGVDIQKNNDSTKLERFSMVSGSASLS